MTTATESRIAALHEQISDADHHMATAAFGTPHLFATYLARRGEAMRELRQMEES